MTQGCISLRIAGGDDALLGKIVDDEWIVLDDVSELFGGDNVLPVFSRILETNTINLIYSDV